MRKSCVIYAEWTDQILNLPNDMAGKYAKAILQYAIYGEKADIDEPFLKAMLVPVKKRLDEDHEKYQAQVDRMNKCRSQKDIYKKSDRSLQEVTSVNVNVNDNENDNDKKHKKKSSIHDFPEREYDFSKLVVKKNV